MYRFVKLGDCAMVKVTRVFVSYTHTHTHTHTHSLILITHTHKYSSEYPHISEFLSKVPNIL